MAGGFAVKTAGVCLVAGGFAVKLQVYVSWQVALLQNCRCMSCDRWLCHAALPLVLN